MYSTATMTDLSSKLKIQNNSKLRGRTGPMSQHFPTSLTHHVLATESRWEDETLISNEDTLISNEDLKYTKSKIRKSKTNKNPCCLSTPSHQIIRMINIFFRINDSMFLQVLWGPVALGHQLDHEVWKPSYPTAHRVMPAKVRGRKPKGLDFLGWSSHPVGLANVMWMGPRMLRWSSWRNVWSSGIFFCLWSIFFYINVLIISFQSSFRDSYRHTFLRDWIPISRLDAAVAFAELLEHLDLPVGKKHLAQLSVGCHISQNEFKLTRSYLDKPVDHIPWRWMRNPY